MKSARRVVVRFRMTAAAKANAVISLAITAHAAEVATIYPLINSAVRTATPRADAARSLG